MGVLRGGKPVPDHLPHTPPVARSDPECPFLLIHLELIAPQLDELSGCAGNQRRTREGGRQLAFQDRGFARAFKLREPSLAFRDLPRQRGLERTL
jgi:hypothetical protein